jgi:D-tyrosyl-tRNA(Tyr) deacylase
MRAVVQRVKEASVKVDGKIVGAIEHGVLVFLGVADGDTDADADSMAEKIVDLRIFEDGDGKMNVSLEQVAGELLAVSQFTLLGDCRKGRRPSFVKAAQPAEAERLYLRFVDVVRGRDVRVATGQFRAMMDVGLINWGPVTLLLDSRKQF